MRKGTPFALVLCSAVSAFAQTARVGGRITDAQGGILPGATVTMMQVDTGLSSATVTNASGSYHFPTLDPGGYHLEIRLAGFAPWTRRDLVLSVGQGITIDATLELAGLSEAITVTGDSPMISNRESKLGGVVESEQIENIPINSRDVQQLALLVPGGKRANSFDPTKSIVPAISFGTNGSGRGILYTLDQGDNTDDVVGGIVQRRLPGLGAPPGGERASVDGGLQRGSRRKRDVRRLHRGSEWRATGTGELQERSHGDSRPPRHRVLPHGGERNLQITFEAFNLFNRVNRGLNFTETFESPNVGEWTQGLETNQAQLQLGIRFQF